MPVGALAPAELAHLVGRFFGAIRPGAPDPDQQRWALSVLNEAERALWERMRNPDRRHSIAVALAVQTTLSGPNAGDGAGFSDGVLAAALMHDVGKVVSDYRTPARVVATFVWLVLGEQRAHDWRNRSRPWRRLAEYRLHPEIGQQLLREAGSETITWQWAGDHHKPEEQWRGDHQILTVLKACDND